MKVFNVRELAETRKSDSENDKTLQEFFEISFPFVPADEINSILKSNRHNWDCVWVHKGTAHDDYVYTDKILRESKGIKENIVSLIILGTSHSITFMYDLKEYADDFSFIASYSLENEKVIYVLFFVKN